MTNEEAQAMLRAAVALFERSGAASTRTTFLRDAVVLSDDAGQFAIGQHALCWVHAEPLVHKLDGRLHGAKVRKLTWNF